MMPRITQPDPRQPVFYALGYGGNGVSFSAHAGRRMAERIAGVQRPEFKLPIYDSPLQAPNVFGLVRSPAFALSSHGFGDDCFAKRLTNELQPSKATYRL